MNTENEMLVISENVTTLNSENESENVTALNTENKTTLNSENESENVTALNSENESENELSRPTSEDNSIVSEYEQEVRNLCDTDDEDDEECFDFQDEFFNMEKIFELVENEIEIVLFSLLV